jgi:hypothetical protein
LLNPGEDGKHGGFRGKEDLGKKVEKVGRGVVKGIGKLFK